MPVHWMSYVMTILALLVAAFVLRLTGTKGTI